MEAKDTVKKVESHSESIWCPHCGEEFGIESKVEYERERQAKITWIMAFKAGERNAQDGIWDKVMGTKKSGYDEGSRLDRPELEEAIKSLLSEYDEARNIAAMDGADEEFVQTELIIVKKIIDLLDEEELKKGGK